MLNTSALSKDKLVINYPMSVIPNQYIHPLNAYLQRKRASEDLLMPDNLLEDYQTSLYIFDEDIIKYYKYYAGEYINKIQEFDEIIESITYNTTLYYGSNDIITISYKYENELEFTLSIINDLKNNIVLDKSKFCKTSFSIVNKNIEYYRDICIILRSMMLTPSVEYVINYDNIILVGPKKQLIIFINKYNELVDTEFSDLENIYPIIENIKKSKKRKN